MDVHNNESDVEGSISGHDQDLSGEEDSDSRLSSSSRNGQLLKPSIDPEVLARIKQHGGMPFAQEDLERSLPFFFTSPQFMASHLAAAAAAAAKGKDIMDSSRDRSPPLNLRGGYPEETSLANPPASDSSTSSTSSQQTWSFEEQFKQGGSGERSSDCRENCATLAPKAGDFYLLYELSDDVKRKEFLDELFSFMQKRGTPINRLPIMAKQVLDLYELYNLVIARGGLVDVINKKLWQEIIKGLHLPSSITSAAFTLRTQYMKYLYPYECEKKRLSTPAELQAAIDGNRREGRRASYGPYPDMVNSSMISPMSLVGQQQQQRSHPQMNGNGNAPHHPLHSTSPHSPPIPNTPSARDALAALELSRLTLWNMYGGGGLPPVAAVDPKAPPQQEALNLEVPTRSLDAPKMCGLESSPKSIKSLYVSSENSNGTGKRSEHHHSSSSGPPPKRMALESPPSPVRTQGTHIKINSRGGDGRGLDTSIAVSMEINGIMYQGVLFAQSQQGRVS